MSNQIRALRLAKGFTLEELGEATGTSAQQIARLETGARRLTQDWMARVARALDVEPAALIADALPDSDSLAEQAEKTLIWRIWQAMGPAERRLWLLWAIDKGIEVANDPEKRRA